MGQDAGFAMSQGRQTDDAEYLVYSIHDGRAPAREECSQNVSAILDGHCQIVEDAQGLEDIGRLELSTDAQACNLMFR